MSGTDLPADSVAQASRPCSGAQGMLMIQRDASVVLHDPASSADYTTSMTPAQATFLSRDLPLAEWFAPRAWQVSRTSDADGYLIEIRDRSSGEVVLSATFERHIELAMSLVSPSGQHVAFLQANNLASEVTLMDAGASTIQTVRLPHDAPLAAFGMEAAFSPDEGCLAISMERSGGPGPETWLVDLATGAASVARPGEIIGWLPAG